VTLIALDDGSKLSGLQRIVENDANEGSAETEIPNEEGTNPGAADDANKE
jgi:DNA gyrase subunit A